MQLSKLFFALFLFFHSSVVGLIEMGKIKKCIFHFNLEHAIIMYSSEWGFDSVEEYVLTEMAKNTVVPLKNSDQKITIYNHMMQKYPKTDGEVDKNEEERREFLLKFFKVLDQKQKERVLLLVEKIKGAKETNYIAPAFLKFVEYLVENKIPYKVIVRPCGLNVNAFISSLSGKFKHFFAPRVVTLSWVKKQGGCQNGFDPQVSVGLTTVGGARNCYEFWVDEIDENIIVDDVFSVWTKNDFEKNFKQFFPIDLSDDTVLQLFFASKDFKKVVAPINVKNDVQSGVPIDSEQLISLKILIDMSDPLTIIEDDMFFIKKFEERKSVMKNTF